MIIETLKIRNFRNYDSISIHFNQGIHFLCGRNGQGKTNLLEAIYYLSCTKSHRTNRVVDLIKEESSFFALEADLLRDQKKVNIRCIGNKSGKNLFLYRNPIKRVSDFIGTLNAVMFTPDDMTLFDGNPKERRRFVDLELGKLSRSYTNTLNIYYKILKDRNAYLKSNDIDVELIHVLDDRLIDCQLTIMKQRKKFLDDVLKNSALFYKKLSDDDTNITYVYQSFVSFDKEDIMKDAMKMKYMHSLDRDRLYKQTHIGIHKDDFIFMINSKEVSSYASQGQKRSIILALKMGIVETIHALSKTYPILLLDDVFSELDERRRHMLLSLLSEEMQIFISSTDRIEISDKKKIDYFEVSHGTIKKM